MKNSFAAETTFSHYPKCFGVSSFEGYRDARFKRERGECSIVQLFKRREQKSPNDQSRVQGHTLA
jgi:hypothetical protein